MPAATSASMSAVFGTSNDSPTLSSCPRGPRRGNIGMTSAPVSRAMRIAPGGRVVSRPKKVIGTPFWKKS